VTRIPKSYSVGVKSNFHVHSYYIVLELKDALVRKTHLMWQTRHCGDESCYHFLPSKGLGLIACFPCLAVSHFIASFSFCVWCCKKR
jgi:hypothetical protein